MPQASLSFPATLDTVREARRFLVTTLAGWQLDGYDLGARVVLSELATNAALHARTAYTVWLRLVDSTELIIEVSDGSPQLPHLLAYRDDATTGRGILLVEALSHSWGATAQDGGKRVWAHVRPDSDAAGLAVGTPPGEAAPS